MRAAIDLGTNSLRAIIAKDHHEPLNIFYEKGFIVRIGEGISAYRHLNPQAKHRTLEALAEIKTAFDHWGVGERDYRFVATSALRDAEDSRAFIEEVKQFGLHMTIITGVEEAQIIANAVHAFVPEHNDHALFVDQGGGSVEFIHHRQGKETLQSLDIGIVRFSERFFKTLPPDKDSLGTYRSFMKKTVNHALDQEIVAKPEQMILIGGTGATLAKIKLGLASFDSLKVHGAILEKSFIQDVEQRLIQMSAEQIAKAYQLDSRRADVFTAGVVQIICLMEVFGFAEVLISDRGLRYGLLLPD
jgi:exopolyphosphatase/guanosine-5'-triphosphate,3'-diphosphate pyrophosphatase